VLVNLQKRYAVRRASLGPFVQNLKRLLRLGGRDFNICFVDDQAIRRLNFAYRGKNRATDVLAFAWNETPGPSGLKLRSKSSPRRLAGIKNFLGDVVISVEMAKRNAGHEGHPTMNEIRWLILHGALHLLGHDHARDSGEMAALELSLREQLGIAGPLGVENKVKSLNAKVKRQKFNPPRL